ncbi:hypothetical protein [Acinetobacter guillouiae]|uniref:hypothetical protein n=1 Tax=Acinetobacter guillouiae TaxID=106649 RepID=UPI002FD9F978
MEPITYAEELANYNIVEINEAETRKKYIDHAFFKIFNWPECKVIFEDHTDTGFMDYKFINSNEKAVMILEAKKTGHSFLLPNQFDDKKLGFFIPLKVLFTDSKIKSVIEQVHSYCTDEGCQLAAISNGHQWIFFKVFEDGKRWKDLRAFVIKSNQYFSQNFTEANNLFNYNSLIKGSLHKWLGSHDWHNRELYYPSTKITSYGHAINSNNYASKFKSFARKYFGIIDPNDDEFMQACYVKERAFKKTENDFREIVRDSVTPFFKDKGVININEEQEISTLEININKRLQHKKFSEVIVLFGGKGSGKSTFLRRIIFHNPPQYFQKNAKFIFVDLLERSPDKEEIKSYIYDKMIESLDKNNVLDSSREELLIFFKDEYQLALKQDLYGFEENSTEFNKTLNSLVRTWKNEKLNIIKKLVKKWNSNHKGCIFILDNTDQFSNHIQDYCFQIAHLISNELNCLVIISMREERYYSSKIHGMLDAFQNSGFHISSPLTKLVFDRRINFVLTKLEDESFCLSEFNASKESTLIKVIKRFFETLRFEFKKDDGHLNSFLNSCAHGNIRIALDLFRDFIKSGYTNVDEMVNSNTYWSIKIHQVLKPLMIPYRFFYNEELSAVPNIFKVRDLKNGSHFTALRILQQLSINSSEGYLSIGFLKEFFNDTFDMLKDFEINIDILLKSGLVESNNRIDFYCDDVDSIKITSYGSYFYTYLYKYFTYLELVCVDSGMFDEQKANEIAELSKLEFKSLRATQRVERVQIRLEKAEKFISYLEDQEKRENERFNSNYELTLAIRDSFNHEKLGVISSAKKQKK